MKFRDFNRVQVSFVVALDHDAGGDLRRRRHHLVDLVDLHFLDPVFLPLFDDVLCVLFGLRGSKAVMGIVRELLQELGDARVVDVAHGEESGLLVETGG